MSFQHTTLENGLEIIAEHNEAALSASLGFFVKTGARDENDDNSGVSHFLEHMVFKGTERRSAADVNRELDELGGFANAYTSVERTVYYAKVLPELLARTIDLFGDILRPSLREDDFNIEKKVVLEEIKKYDDQPPFGLEEKYREYFWRNHPLSRSVSGSCETVSGITPEIMRDYFTRRYSSDNIVVVVCGQFDFDDVVAQVQKTCGHWRPSEPTRELFQPVSLRGTHVFNRADASQEYVVQMVDAPSAVATNRRAATLLADVVGDDVGSRLFWELVDTGRADAASFHFRPYLDAGLFLTTLVCRPEDCEENLKIIRATLERVQAEGVKQDELTRAKNKLLAHIAANSERSQSRMFSIGRHWLFCGQYQSVSEKLDAIRAVSVDDVNSILAQYSLNDPMTMAIGPLETLRP